MALAAAQVYSERHLQAFRLSRESTSTVLEPFGRIENH